MRNLNTQRFLGIEKVSLFLTETAPSWYIKGYYLEVSGISSSEGNPFHHRLQLGYPSCGTSIRTLYYSEPHDYHPGGHPGWDSPHGRKKRDKLPVRLEQTYHDDSWRCPEKVEYVSTAPGNAIFPPTPCANHPYDNRTPSMVEMMNNHSNFKVHNLCRCRRSVSGDFWIGFVITQGPRRSRFSSFNVSAFVRFNVRSPPFRYHPIRSSYA